jgi:hypothetical protein
MFLGELVIDIIGLVFYFLAYKTFNIYNSLL